MANKCMSSASIICTAFIIVLMALFTLFEGRLYAVELKSGTGHVVASSPSVKYPALVDVGARKCIPCKMMAPILDELSTEYAGILRVEFIDVQTDCDKAMQLGVRGIPTQIFYDSKGKELYRHIGFISKEDILRTFDKLGVKLTKKDPGKKIK